MKWAPGICLHLMSCALALGFLFGCETAGAARSSGEKSAPVVAASEKNVIPTLGATLLDGFEGPEHSDGAESCEINVLV